MQRNFAAAIVFECLLACFVTLLHPTHGQAGCGTPVSGQSSPRATDALRILSASVGTSTCTLGSCDVNRDCVISASDALNTLLAAIGTPAMLDCSAACPSPTPCESAASNICNGTCPYGMACAASESSSLAPDPRVTVCHGVPRRTSTVPLGALDDHLAHGDALRACEQANSQSAAPVLSNSLGGASGTVSACSCVVVEVPTTTTTTTSTSTSVTLPAAPADDSDNDGLVDSEDPCPTEPLNECFGHVAIDTSTQLPVRLNANAADLTECGGNRIDCTGRVWLADFGYNKRFTGSDCDINIAGQGCSIRNTSDIFGCSNKSTEDVLLCEHFDRAPEPNLIYSFNVPNGRYLVNFLFANTFKETRTVGSRLFNVAIEGAIVLENFDQVATAGGSRIAIVRSIVVEISDGDGMQIEFGHVVENPTVKAIEILTNSAF